MFHRNYIDVYFDELTNNSLGYQLETYRGDPPDPEEEDPPGGF